MSTDIHSEPNPPPDSGPATPDASSAERQGGWTPGLVVSLFCIAMVMEIVSLSYSTVNTALPLITAEFRTLQGGWLLTASLLFGAVISPLAGSLADLYGKRRVLFGVMAVAWLGSVICTLAPSFPVLVAGRALEGALMACLFLSYSLMRDVYPPRTVPLAVSICTSGLGLAAIVAPLLTGWLLGTWGWRSIFAFDAIWVLVMLVAILLTTPESPRRRAARLDIRGAVLLGTGIATVLIVVSFGQEWGWASPVTLGMLAVGIALLAGWWFSARRTPEPLIDIALVRTRPIVLTAVTAALAYGGTVISSILLPLMSLTPRTAGLGYGLSLTPLEFAMIASPNAAGLVLGGLLVGSLVRRINARLLMATGLAVLAVGAALLTSLPDTVLLTSLFGLIAGFGAGMGYAAVPNLVIAATPPDQQASVASVVQVAQTGFCAILPIALFALLAANVASVAGGAPLYSAVGMRIGWSLLIGIGLVGAVAAVTVFRPRPGDRTV